MDSNYDPIPLPRDRISEAVDDVVRAKNRHHDTVDFVRDVVQTHSISIANARTFMLGVAVGTILASIHDKDEIVGALVKIFKGRV